MGLLPLAMLMRKPGGGSVAESSGWVMDKALVSVEGESLLLWGSSAGTGVGVVDVIRHKDTTRDKQPGVKAFCHAKCMICNAECRMPKNRFSLEIQLGLQYTVRMKRLSDGYEQRDTF